MCGKYVVWEVQKTIGKYYEKLWYVITQTGKMIDY